MAAGGAELNPIPPVKRPDQGPAPRSSDSIPAGGPLGGQSGTKGAVQEGRLV